MPRPIETHGWGRAVDKWHDERDPFHLLKGDGAPACGVPYYATTGAQQGVQDCNKCRRCLRIEARAARVAGANTATRVAAGARAPRS